MFNVSKWKSGGNFFFLVHSLKTYKTVIYIEIEYYFKIHVLSYSVCYVIISPIMFERLQMFLKSTHISFYTYFVLPFFLFTFNKNKKKRFRKAKGKHERG